MAYSLTPTIPDLDNAQVGTTATDTLLDEVSDALHSAYARVGCFVTSQGWPDSQLISTGTKRTACRWKVPIPSDGPREIRARVHAEHAAGLGGTVYLETFSSYLGAVVDSASYTFNAGVGTAELINLTADLPEGVDEAFVRLQVEGVSSDAANDVEVYRAGLRILPLTTIATGTVRTYGGGLFAPGRSTANLYPYPTSEHHAKLRTARAVLAIPRMIGAWSGVHGGASADLTPRIHTPTRRDARQSIVPPMPVDIIPGSGSTIECRYFAAGGASDVTWRPTARVQGSAYRARGTAVSVTAAAAGAWYSSTITLPTREALPRMMLDIGIEGIDPADCSVSSWSAWSL